jgi:hypothetical protein
MTLKHIIMTCNVGARQLKDFGQGVGLVPPQSIDDNLSAS